MSDNTVQQTPGSDRFAGLVALRAGEGEDPIGPAVTNPDGKGVRGKTGVRDFFDANIAKKPAHDYVRGHVSIQLPQ